jgi:hypothetical protein
MYHEHAQPGNDEMRYTLAYPNCEPCTENCEPEER